MNADVFNALIVAYVLGILTPIAMQFFRHKIPEIKAGMKIAKAIKNKKKGGLE